MLLKTAVSIRLQMSLVVRTIRAWEVLRQQDQHTNRFTLTLLQGRSQEQGCAFSYG
jgi:hypothetical protein